MLNDLMKKLVMIIDRVRFSVRLLVRAIIEVFSGCYGILAWLYVRIGMNLCSSNFDEC